MALSHTGIAGSISIEQVSYVCVHTKLNVYRRLRYAQAVHVNSCRCKMQRHSP